MEIKDITNLKRQKTRLLNIKCDNEAQFNLIQEKLNEIELQLKLLKEDK